MPKKKPRKKKSMAEGFGGEMPHEEDKTPGIWGVIEKELREKIPDVEILEAPTVSINGSFNYYSKGVIQDKTLACTIRSLGVEYDIRVRVTISESALERY